MTVVGRPVLTRRGSRAAFWLAPLGVAVLVCVAAVLAVGAVMTVPATGHPTPDVRVGWLLPASRLVADVSGAVTVGCLVAAGLLVPGARFVSPAGYRWLRAATWSAAAWALAGAVALPGLLAEFLDSGLGQASPATLLSFVRDVPEGRAQASVVVLTGLVAVGSRAVLTMAGARTMLLVSLAATLPPAVIEYLEDDGGRVLAVVALVGMVLHIAGALAWSGALVALLLLGSRPERTLAVRRFSRCAPLLVLAVGMSGLLSAAVELDAPGQILSTDFGRLVVLKALALGGLVTVGWWHRRRSLPALAAGGRGVFRRVAWVELMIFAATMGLAVALSRTPAPDADEPSAVGAASVAGAPL